jgi:mannan endo-1,4-beta-mannosidase
MNKQIFKSNGLMNKLICCAAVVFYAGFSQSSFGATTTADPNAMQDAKRILAYYYSLTSKTDTRVIAGQLAYYSSGFAQGYTQNIVGLQTATGKWVALLGADYNSSITTPTPTLISWFKAGGLVAVSDHLPSPGGTLASIIVPGGTGNSAWMATLDQRAAALKTLQDSGVVVIWRPFLEMNGGWFWWGNGDVTAFVALWRHMFNYFTTTKGLHNLLWNYSPNIGANVTKYYPGDAYVDIVGLDGYYAEPTSLNIPEYASMLTYNKPLGFGEFGGIPAGGGSQNVFDNAVLINSIKANYPKMCYFMPWHCSWSIVCQKNATQLMTDPWVITRDKLTWKTMTPIADNGMKRAAPLVLSRTNSPQVLYTMQGRAIKYSGKGTVPAGLYFSKEPGSQAAGQSMRKVVIGNGRE